MIGLSAVLLMWLNGRIAGISGISSGVLPPWGDGVETGWRIAFLVGLLLAPVAAFLVSGVTVGEGLSPSSPLLAIASALVGFGAVFGGGCTSGHGVCGLSRLSVRSAVAVATFMATAALTVFIMRHVL